ncbi:hypothetical protein Dsin_021136 [Dipteronia sinensis]|uniref:Uncharacterized protein n=1 Tax=Dipteronia sinensis TaxID=43782 RepID=A0AAE0AAK9_9ROSI|nr:hypothetical protein Dsin_021136 [Dipteronia sinensis]
MISISVSISMRLLRKGSFTIIKNASNCEHYRWTTTTDIYEFPEAVGLSNGFPKESTSSSQVVPPGGLLELQFSDRWRFMELMEQEEMQNLLSEEIENQIEMELKEKKKTDPNWLFRR